VSYKILGVDPGTNVLGYAVMNIDGSKINIADFGVIKLHKEKDHQSKLKEIFLQLQEIIETHLPKYMAVEAPFHGKNVQRMLKLGRAQGVSMAAGITMGLEIFEYAPKKIKQSVTGSGNASKEQVAGMLESILRVKIDSKYLDATDALAVAMTHYNQLGFGGGSVTKKYKGWGSFVKDNASRVK
jgi:crossover junction endodeoxyribonuclease RuvC